MHLRGLYNLELAATLGFSPGTLVHEHWHAGLAEAVGTSTSSKPCLTLRASVDSTWKQREKEHVRCQCAIAEGAFQRTKDSAHFRDMFDPGLGLGDAGEWAVKLVENHGHGMYGVRQISRGRLRMDDLSHDIGPRCGVHEEQH